MGAMQLVLNPPENSKFCLCILHSSQSTAQHEKHKEPYSSGEGPSMPVPYSSGEGPSTPVLSQPRTPALEQPRILAQGQASSLAPTRCIVNTSNLHSSAYESQLRDMFPDENLEVIQSAIAGNYDITGAINHLLKVHGMWFRYFYYRDKFCEDLLLYIFTCRFLLY